MNEKESKKLDYVFRKVQFLYGLFMTVIGLLGVFLLIIMLIAFFAP